jgi:hypothetical protein
VRGDGKVAYQTYDIVKECQNFVYVKKLKLDSCSRDEEGSLEDCNIIRL